MRWTTYSKYVGSLLEALNLQDLLDRLADFLLQSGFRRHPHGLPGRDDPWDPGSGEADLDDLKRAILRALLESGQMTPEMLEALRGEDEGAGARQLAELLDRIVERLVDEGYLTLETPPQVPDAAQPVTGPGSVGKAAQRSVKFHLTEKSVDLLGYKALRDLLGSVGRASVGAHETPYLSTGVEAEAVARPYEFGDTLNLDVNATLLHAIRRVGPQIPLDLDYADLHVHQSEYRSSCATVLLLDCSHSMILYGEDRFTPAKKVALALAHLIRTQYPGDTLRVVLFHDSAEEVPLARLARVRVGPYHTNTAEGLRLARHLLRGQRTDMRQIVMITDGKPSAMTLPGGRVYKNPMGLDPRVLRATFREVAECRRARIQINTFMLARDRALVEFVKQMTALCRGRAYFTTTLTLGQYLMMDFLRRTARRVR
jgi:Ca-activated chloride channel family protein